MNTQTLPSLDLLKVHREQIRQLCRKYDVHSLQVFGSVAREESQSGSDVDFLVRFARPVNLFRLVRLERELGKNLDVSVDLVTENALSPYIRSQVLASNQVLYEGA